MLTAAALTDDRLSGVRELSTSSRASRGSPIATIESVLLGFVSFGLYVAAGIVLRDHFGYSVGDALARTAKAVYMGASRDPHFGAVGFYWPPLSSTAQIPLVLVLKPFGRMDLAGPISSACWAAAAGVLLGRLSREIGLGRPTSFMISLLFVTNPVIFVYAVNGMSESCLYFFLIMASLAWLRWVRRRAIGDLALMGAALAAAVLVRIEALPVVFVLALAAGACRDWRQWTTRAITVMVPPLFAFACWLGVQWILLGDAIAFLHYDTGQNNHGRRPHEFLHSFGLPDTHGSYLAALPWAASWLVVFAPALIALVLAALASPRRHLYAMVGIVGSAVVFPLVQVVLIVHDTGFGDPRYFTSMIPLGFVAVAWLAASARPGWTSPPSIFGEVPVAVGRGTAAEVHTQGDLRTAAVGLAAVATLLVASVVSMTFMLNPLRTRIGNEHYVYNIVLGRPVRITKPLDDSRHLADYLDPYLAHGKKAIIDTGFGYGPILFSRHPSGFIIQEDRDFRSILDSPTGKFDFIVAPAISVPGTIDVIGPLVSPPEAWRLVGQYGDAKVYASMRSAGAGETSNDGPTP